MVFGINQPLVSIIIPCFNCEKWVRQAVESCLDQSYKNIEIIVIDDGSTDGGPEALSQFLPRIRFETGTNRGGNHARNRGFAFSTGEYIQYLDADDYLEPDTIARQVRCLEETKADVVYGDWRFRRHLRDSSFSYLDGVTVGRIGPDILASSLSGDNPPTGAVLYRRRVIGHVGGWDETLSAAQDRDFFTTVVLSGATVRYAAGCCYVYRKYGAVTVSSSNLTRWVESHCTSLRKSEAALARSGKLAEKYKTALAYGYFALARGTTHFDARSSFIYSTYREMLSGVVDKVLDLSPNFHPTDETSLFRIINRLFGLRIATRLLWTRLIVRSVKLKLRETFLLNLVLRFRRVNILYESVDGFGPSSTHQVGAKRAAK